MALFALNIKLEQQFNREPLSVDELANAIWPEGEDTTYCGSVASCLTCFQIKTWLSEEIGLNHPSCLDPDEKLLPGKLPGSYIMSTKVNEDRCCLGHGMNDQLYTSFSSDSSRAVTDGPTNKQILHLLQSHLVTTDVFTTYVYLYTVVLFVCHTFHIIGASMGQRRDSGL